MRRILILSLLLTLPTTQEGAAQEVTDYRDDLRFVESLRSRGDNDLALEFLQRLAKGAPAELAKELPLEFAKTRLRVASEEAETTKRLQLYKEASEDFAKFIAANPGHPRIPEANFDIARVLNMQGKTELNRALNADDARTSREMAATARATLQAAAGKLQAASKELEKQLATLPDPADIPDPKKKKEAEARKTRVEDDLKQMQFESALNLYDQSLTYIGGQDEAASALLTKAVDALKPLASENQRYASTWKATAWLGRIALETETAERARARFQTVINARALPAAAEGNRLARYFRMIAIRKQPLEEDKKYLGGPNRRIIDSGRAWRTDYRRFLNTPEGHGASFLLAEVLLEAAENPKFGTPTERDKMRQEARVYLRELENSENEFTEQAKRMKIRAMARLGLFQVPLVKLVSFEDNFIRAQYEAFQLSQDKVSELERQMKALPDPASITDAKAKKEAAAQRKKLEGELEKLRANPAELEKARKEHINNILATLKKALATPEAKKQTKSGSMELNNARAMYTYWAMNTGDLAEAIRVGEDFARSDPRSSQAEMSAIYALQSYAQLIDQKAARSEDIAAERERLISLATYIEDRWPRTFAGDLARHTIGLRLLKEENFAEAIKKLSTISPSYSNYTLVCFQIADVCEKAEKADTEPIAGDRKGDYRKRALVALANMPDSALGVDGFTNQLLIAGRAKLGRDLFRYRRFQQMDDLATKYLEQLDKLKFNAEEDKDRAARNQLRYELVDLKLYARYGLADAAFQAEDFARVVALTDPLIDAVLKDGEGQEKTNLQKNQPLASGTLMLALRSNFQLGKIDRTDQVLDVLDQVVGEGGDPTNILKLLAFLIRTRVEELRAKAGKDEVTKAINGYSAILDKRIKKQKNLTPDFIRVLADCYSSMERHEQAAAELSKVKDPKAKPGTPEEKSYRQVQLSLIRELRLSKKKENLQKAREMMTAVMGDADPKSPKFGWGRRDLIALIEEGKLLEAEEKYGQAFTLFSDLHRRLGKDAAKGGAIKERFLECTYHMVSSATRIGMSRTAKDDRDKYLKPVAQKIDELVKTWGDDFGSDASKKRFTTLLAEEPVLREMYEAIQKQKK